MVIWSFHRIGDDVPFAFFARIRAWVKVVGVSLMVAGVAVTFSRNALVACRYWFGVESLACQQGYFSPTAFTIEYCRRGCGGRDHFARDTSLDSAGDEVKSSTDYRFQMLSLLPDIRFLGVSGTLYTLSDGQPGYASTDYLSGAARSVDNTFVLLGLNVGWLAVILSGGVVLAVAFLQMRSSVKDAGRLGNCGATSNSDDGCDDNSIQHLLLDNCGYGSLWRTLKAFGRAALAREGRVRSDTATSPGAMGSQMDWVERSLWRLDNNPSRAETVLDWQYTNCFDCRCTDRIGSVSVLMEWTTRIRWELARRTLPGRAFGALLVHRGRLV